MLMPVIHMKQFACRVRQATAARGSRVDLARSGFRISNELGDFLGRNRRVYFHDKGGLVEARDWRDVADKVEMSFPESVAFIALGTPAKRSV
jgi:hypothetical protein